MVDGKADRETLVAEVGIKSRQHLRTHHAFVDNCAAAYGGEINVRSCGTEGGASPLSAASAQAEQQGFKGVTLNIRAQQPLLDQRRGATGERTENVGSHRHDAPPQGPQTQTGGLLIAELTGLGRSLCISGQEHHCQTTGLSGTGCRCGPHCFEVAPGNAAEHPSAVTGIPITAATTAMLHAAQPPQRLLQQPVGLLPLELCQETDTTSVLFACDCSRSWAVAMGPDSVVVQGHRRRTHCWAGPIP